MGVMDAAEYGKLHGELPLAAIRELAAERFREITDADREEGNTQAVAWQWFDLERYAFRQNTRLIRPDQWPRYLGMAANVQIVRCCGPDDAAEA